MFDKTLNLHFVQKFVHSCIFEIHSKKLCKNVLHFSVSHHIKWVDIEMSSQYSFSHFGSTTQIWFKFYCRIHFWTYVMDDCTYYQLCTRCQCWKIKMMYLAHSLRSLSLFLSPLSDTHTHTHIRSLYVCAIIDFISYCQHLKLPS